MFSISNYEKDLEGKKIEMLKKLTLTYHFSPLQHNDIGKGINTS